MKKEIIALVLCLFAAPLAAIKPSVAAGKPFVPSIHSSDSRTRGVASTSKTAQMDPTARIAEEMGIMPKSKAGRYLHNMPTYRELKKLERKNLAQADLNISSRQAEITRLKKRLDWIVQKNQEKIKDGYIEIVEKDLTLPAGTAEGKATELRVADLQIMMHKQSRFRQRIKQFLHRLCAQEDDMMICYGLTQGTIDRLQKEVDVLLTNARKPHHEKMNRLEKQIKNDPTLLQLRGQDRIAEVKKGGVVR